MDGLGCWMDISLKFLNFVLVSFYFNLFFVFFFLLLHMRIQSY